MSNGNDEKKVWVHAEIVDGGIPQITLELISKARELASDLGEGASVEVTLIGSDVRKFGCVLASYGASKIYLADNESLELFSPVSYTSILVGWAKKHRPYIYLFGATSIGSMLGPSVAARLKTGMAAHCVDLRINTQKKLSAMVPSFGGKVIGEIICPNNTPQMASVKRGVFEKRDPFPVTLNIEETIIEQSVNEAKYGYLSPVRSEKHPLKGVPLLKADIVICGGYGIEKQKNWHLIEKIASYLGGASACTRPIVDEGWTEESSMIGTSGQTVRPKVYIGFGVSGATHHTCGMNKSKLIININRDASAPIFEVSDYKVQADVNDILPLLEEALKK
jgi:electron transfer flavoprotein alpha subunit